MRVKFEATEWGFDDPEDAIICGVSNGREYLTFQRALHDEDQRVHLEYCDQSNGGYGCIELCGMSNDSITINLRKQLGRLVGVEGFDVSLAISPDDRLKLREYLQAIFRDQESLFRIS